MNTQKGLISVIIINYKTPKLTVECVESILQFTQGVDFEIIIVDNGSGSELREYFDQYMPDDDRVRLIYLPNNLGFGGGNNLGYANSRGEYLFFLNSDTIFFENSLKLLYEEYASLSEKIKLGLLGPRLYLDHAKTKTQVTGTINVSVANVIIASIPNLNKIFRAQYNKFTIFGRDRGSSRQLSAVCGAALFVSRSIRNEIGGFDERFFLYMEEFDLAMRTRVLGYSNFYTIETSIIHLENQSPKITRKKTIFSLKSLYLFTLKYLFSFH